MAENMLPGESACLIAAASFFAGYLFHWTSSKAIMARMKHRERRQRVLLNDLQLRERWMQKLP